MGRALLLAAAIVLVGGCGVEDRKPIPLVEIVIPAKAGEYLVQGKQTREDELPARLQEIADSYRRGIVNDARAIVHIYHAPTVSWNRVQRVMGICNQVGLDKVTTQVRETPDAPPPAKPPSNLPN